MNVTLLSLENWRERIGHNPWHFWQLANSLVPLVANCNTLVRQYSWQRADAAGRQDISEAIKTAEDRLWEYLTYPIAPKWIDETIDVSNLWTTSPFPLVLKLGAGKVRQVATATWTLLGSSAIALSDKDNDGVKDTWTITFANSSIDLATAELGVFFQTADQSPLQTDFEEAQIHPVTITRLNANTLQFQGRLWTLVPPLKYEGSYAYPGYDSGNTGISSAGSLDPNLAGTYATSVDIYQHVITNTDTCNLIYDANGAQTTTQLTATVMNKETGEVRLNANNSTSIPNNWWYPGYAVGGIDVAPWFAYSNQADQGGSIPPVQRVQISYQAGANIKDWQTIVARFAAAELLRPICACKEANRELYRWQQNLALTSTGDEQFRVSEDDLGNELGTRAGMIYAWKRIRNGSLVRGKFI